MDIVPLAYEVARAFTFEGHVLPVGHLLTEEQVAVLNIDSKIEHGRIRVVVVPPELWPSGEDPAPDAPAAAELTVAALKTLVADNPGLAQDLLDQELAADKPRAGAVAFLEATLKAGQGTPA
jgi:hypothetical protein